MRKALRFQYAKSRAALAAAQPVMANAEILSERWVDPTTVVIDSLLAACHQAEKTQMYVGEIAQDVEVILGGRGDYRKIEAREVGHRIKQLGLVTEARNSKGFRLVLTQPVRRRVHELARSLAVPTIQNSVVRCEDCQGKAR